MAGFTTYAANKILEHSLGQAAWTMPTNVWVALFTADPTDAGVLTNEVANAGGYARVELTALLGAATNSIIGNNTAFAFPTATAAWGIVTYVAILDSGVHGAGNMIYSSALGDATNVEIGDDVAFKIDKYRITLV